MPSFLRLKLLAGIALAAVAAPAVAQDADTAARIAAMQAQIDAMQKQLDELKALQARPTAAATTTATPPAAAAAPAPAGAPPVAVAWKGAPELSAPGGWRFKPRGRMQYDIADVGNPNDAIATNSLGFNGRSRRILLGAEGDVPGGFKWRAEFDFANSGVGYEDVIFQYAPKDSPFSVTVGNFYPFASLELMTSSGATSFLERAQMNEGFGQSRRIGAAVGYAAVDGKLRFNAGVFNDAISNSFGNDDWLFSARATFSPEALGGTLHLGANYQHREFQTSALSFQYRSRPFVQTTDVRFVDSGAIAATGDDIFGLEAAGIFAPLHVAGEAQWVKTDAVTPGDTLTGRESVGAATRYVGSPGFFSGYVEAGWWLTGETRGYKNGAFDRTKVLNGFDKGGWGAFGVNARYDFLDLRDRVGGGLPGAPALVDGGTQTGYLFSVVWQPIDYVRFVAQYTRAEIGGGPRAATVVPVSPLAVTDRDYGLDVWALRAQFDF